jgi:hypothetical protein
LGQKALKKRSQRATKMKKIPGAAKRSGIFLGRRQLRNRQKGAAAGVI